MLYPLFFNVSNGQSVPNIQLCICKLHFLTFRWKRVHETLRYTLRVVVPGAGQACNPLPELVRLGYGVDIYSSLWPRPLRGCLGISTATMCIEVFLFIRLLVARIPRVSFWLKYISLFISDMTVTLQEKISISKLC